VKKKKASERNRNLRLARALCAQEGKKKQVDIAQMSEVVASLRWSILNNKRFMLDLVAYVYE